MDVRRQRGADEAPARAGVVAGDHHAQADARPSRSPGGLHRGHHHGQGCSRLADQLRHRLAMDLHDGPAQELTYLLSVARGLQRQRPDPDQRRIIEAAERALDELRLVIEVGADDGETGLGDLLSDIAERMTARSGVRLLMCGDLDLGVTNEVADALGRIAREAVHNAITHGRADTISLDIRGTPGLVVTIADNGCGFDPQAVGHARRFGLTGMAERALRIGGRCTVESVPGRGTIVDVVLPREALVVRS